MPSDASSTAWLIRGGRVIDPERGMDAVADVAIRDGLIVEAAAGEGGRVFDAQGLIVIPGLIDIHVHLREPGGEHKETLASGTAAAVAGGFTTVACMPNTRPALDSPEQVAWVRRRADQTGACRVLPIAAVTAGRRGRELVDVEGLRRAGAVAFSDDGAGVADDRIMEEALARAWAVGAVVVQHCEDRALASGGVVHPGAAAEQLGLRGLDPRAEEVMIERDLTLLRRTAGRYHVAHISTAGAVDLVRRAKADGLAVTAEVTPHHLTLCDEDVLACGGDPNFKMNPPLRSRTDLEACVRGILDDTIDCVATDHAPHTAEEKAAGFADAPFGIVGLETALPLVHGLLRASESRVAARTACQDRQTPGSVWTMIVWLMSTRPARVLGLRAPSLEAGRPADLTLIDPDATWTVDPDRFVSKGRNTPFAGREMTARVVATFVGGGMRYVHAAAEKRSGMGSR